MQRDNPHLSSLFDQYRHVLSHDLRACVRAIDGFSKIMLNKGEALDVAKKKEYLEIINSNAHILDAQILGLIEYDRHRHQEPRLKDCPLKEIIVGVESNFDKREFSSTYEMDKTSLMKMDEQMLKFIIHELLQNSIKFKREDQQLEVKWKYEEINGVQTLHFLNNGKEIETSNISKALELFQTFKQSENEGIGLGLAIVNIIVLKHRGSVTIGNNNQQGIEIIVKIPR